MEKVMKSIWNENLKMPQFNELAGDLHTEVCIIGGGLCGLLTAKKLVDKCDRTRGQQNRKRTDFGNYRQDHSSAWIYI